jgi:C4-dicarboxylate-specific signal transduction histidine kinase
MKRSNVTLAKVCLTGENNCVSRILACSNISAVLRYAVAIASVATALVLALMLERHWHSTPFVSLFLCAIMFSAWFGGFGPGFLAIALSLLAFTYYFIPPTHSLVIAINELPRLILFAVAGLLVGFLAAAQRSATESLRRARDDLAAKVHELKNINTTLHAEIAERHRAEQALRQAQAELAHVTRLTTIGELTASIAHEVNQPLTAVVNNANSCLDLLPTAAPQLEEVRAALAEILEDADRASAVVARVRQLAKRGPIEKFPLHLRDVVNDVLAIARYESVARHVSIRTDLPPDLPPVLGDRVQLQQVLLNLVINGMDAMNSVEDQERNLIISGRDETKVGVNAVILYVRDSGVGLKMDEMDRLFEAFYTTKPQGMGMGLAISRSIIEAHGGRLWAEPNRGPGATFFFNLPSAGKTKS